MDHIISFYISNFQLPRSDALKCHQIMERFQIEKCTHKIEKKFLEKFANSVASKNNKVHREISLSFKSFVRERRG